MTEEEKETKEYYVVHGRPKSGGRHGFHYEWNYVDKATFARFDGEALCGTTAEITQAIAEAEVVPVSWVHHQGTDYGFQIYCSDNNGLPAAMEYSQRTGRSIRAHHPSTIGDVQKETGKKSVICVGYSHYIVDAKWIISGGTVSYDPSEAEKAIAQKAQQQAASRTPDGKPKHRRSRISWREELMPMLNALQGAITALPEFKIEYSGSYRSWGRRSLFMCHGPDNNAQAILALPKMADMCFKLTGERRYRTKAFVIAAKILAVKHLDDVLMDDVFKRFVLRDSRGRAFLQRKKKPVEVA